MDSTLRGHFSAAANYFCDEGNADAVNEIAMPLCTKPLKKKLESVGRSRQPAGIEKWGHDSSRRFSNA